MKRMALASTLLLMAVACGDGASPTSAAREPAGDGLPTGPSALDDPEYDGFPPPLVDPSEIISGGPPPDGIPPIDQPKFRSIDDAELSLEDTEAVVVIEVDGDARAYPVEILIWHEIVNDTVGGTPVAITYCPLCNSAISYRREVRGVETTFGTSGMLYASALVMYDRATESLWTHFDGRAVAGLLAGDMLEQIASPLISWGDFKAAFPAGQVLSRDTGHRRNYGQNPYFGYDNPDTAPFLYRGTADERARAKERVVGVTLGGEAKAFALSAISGGRTRATNAEVGGEPIVILWKEGQSTALEGANTSDGRDVGSVGVFSPVAEGSRLTFETAGAGFVDLETRSTWDITGRALSGELAGTSLERIPHLDTFWFAWATYQPGTELITDP